MHKKQQETGNSNSASMKRRYEDMRNYYQKKYKRGNFSSFGIGGMSLCKIHVKVKGVSTHAMKKCGRTEVYIHLFLTLALVEVRSQLHPPVALFPGPLLSIPVD